MDAEYTTFTDVESQAPPSYTVRIGALGNVNVAEDQQLTIAPGVNQSEDELNDDLSSVGEAFDVASITSSIDDRLT